MKELNRNQDSFEEFLLYCHLLNEDAVVDSKPSSKRMTSANPTIGKTNPLEQVHLLSL